MKFAGVKFEEIKKLHQKKFREEFGCFLLEGEHLVQELQKAMAQDARLRASEIYLTREYAHWTSPVPIHVINSRDMTRLSETRSPQGIAAVVPLLVAPPPQPGERAIYLHEIQDPGNLGTILRTLAWFGKFRCLLSPNSVDVHNGKAVRASMGAIFHVPVETDVPIEALPARFGRIASAPAYESRRSQPFMSLRPIILRDQSPNQSSAYVVGRSRWHRKVVPRNSLGEINARLAV